MWVDFAGAVQALHHHAPVAREAGEDGERHVGVEAVDGVDLGHVVVALCEGGHLQVGVDAEHLAHAEHPVGSQVCGIGHSGAFEKDLGIRPSRGRCPRRRRCG
jgi:hypothetical protein